MLIIIIIIIIIIIDISEDDRYHFWDINIPLSSILPSSKGPGRWAKALIDELVKAHNKFLKFCCDVLKEQQIEP